VQFLLEVSKGLIDSVCHQPLKAWKLISDRVFAPISLFFYTPSSLSRELLLVFDHFMFDFVHSVKASFKLSQEFWVACADYLSTIKR